MHINDQKRLRILASRAVRKLFGKGAHDALTRDRRADHSKLLGELADPASVYDPAAVGDIPDGFEQVVGRDEIVPVYDPRFTSADDTPWDDDDLVIGIAAGASAKAYPVRALDKREMVLDTIDGTPILVSWCPKCATAMVHDRRTDGTEIVLGNQGGIWHNAMTWWDHDTGSIWSQPFGRAIAGPRKGSTIDLLPSTLTSWGAWRAAHPRTAALAAPSRNHRYRTDDLALVATIDGETAGFGIGRLRQGEIIYDNIGGVSVAAFADPEDPALCYVLDRNLGDGAVQLEVRDGTIVDREAGTIVDLPRTGGGTAATAGSILKVVPTSTVKPEDFEHLWPDSRMWL